MSDELPAWARGEAELTDVNPAKEEAQRQPETPAWVSEDPGDDQGAVYSSSSAPNPTRVESAEPPPSWAVDPVQDPEPEKTLPPPSKKKEKKVRPEPTGPKEHKTWDCFCSFPESSMTRCCCFDFGLRYFSSLPGEHVQNQANDQDPSVMEPRWYLLDIFCCECACQADEKWDLCQVLCCEFSLCCCCIPDTWCKKPSQSYQTADCCEANCGFRAMCLKMAMVGDDWEKDDNLCKMNCCCFHTGCDSAFYGTCQICCVKYDPGQDDDEGDSYSDISKSKERSTPRSKQMRRDDAEKKTRKPREPRDSTQRLEMRQEQRDKERQRNEIRKKYGLPVN